MIKFNKQKRILILFFVSFLFGSTFILVLGTNEVKADGLTVADSFDSPAGGPRGLAWDGYYLWNSDHYHQRIYKIIPSTGEVVHSFKSPGEWPRGLTWDGQYLWNVDYGHNKIYKLKPSTGEVVDSFDSPGGSPEGLTWDGQYLLNYNAGDGKIYKLKPSTGEIVGFFYSPAGAGLTWDGQYLWASHSGRDKIYKLKPSNGKIVASFDAPGMAAKGLAWDGKYLWCADAFGDAWDPLIFKLALGSVSLRLSISCPNEVATGQSFTINIEVKNIDKIDLKNVTAIISLPSWASLTSGSTEEVLGTMKVGAKKTVAWKAKASDPGVCSIEVIINSANAEPESITHPVEVKSSFAYILTGRSGVGLQLTVWLILILFSVSIGLLVGLKLRRRPKKALSFPDLEKKELTPVERISCPFCTGIITEYMEVCPECGAEISKCPVCKTIIKLGDDIIKCPHCKTLFHRTHLLEWIKIKGICPVCKKPLKEIEIPS